MLSAPPLRAERPDAALCPQAVLSRLQRYKVAPGDSLEQIARRHNVFPTTLMGLNPSLRSGKVTVGSEIVIPPYNGIQVETSPGQTWQSLANTYKVRADVLFEANGCGQVPRMVFIPGVNWSPIGTTTTNQQTATLIKGYPLPAATSSTMGYGWQLNPVTNAVTFHSGLDLKAAIGTSVLAVGDGVVAFAGEQGAYGKLVVINHQQGRQTRYAQLGSIQVKVGEQVRTGTVIGTVGTTGYPSSKTPHLHFEVRLNSKLGWVAEDPGLYLRSAPARLSRP